VIRGRNRLPDRLALRQRERQDGAALVQRPAVVDQGSAFAPQHLDPLVQAGELAVDLVDAGAETREKAVEPNQFVISRRIAGGKSGMTPHASQNADAIVSNR
jgi:hypothetical protein